MSANDPEMIAFEAALLRSAEQAVKGEYARVRTPADMRARQVERELGRVVVKRKVAVTIRLDEAVLEVFKATGRGWRSRINNALREWLKNNRPK